jgi:DNA replication protein DnaC
VPSSRALPVAETFRRLNLVDTPALTPIAPAASRSVETTPARCGECGGSGWYTRPVQYGHPDFARLIPCRCTEEARQKLRLERLARMSNLGAFGDKTFATFDQHVPGVQAAHVRAVEFARRPVGWLALFGP